MAAIDIHSISTVISKIGAKLSLYLLAQLDVYCPGLPRNLSADRPQGRIGVGRGGSGRSKVVR